MEYHDYLKSPKWQRQRNKCFVLHTKKCVICKTKNVDVHHKTYKRIFNENVAIDLIPLCRFHHNQVHIFANTNELPLYQATEQYIKKHKVVILDWKMMSPYERDKFLGKGL